MNIEKTNKLIIISSPSGAGKTTLCKLLLKKMKNIELSISYTSRGKRLNEKNGKDYFFVSKNKFLELESKNFFIETAKNFNHYYGSPFKNVKKAKRNKKNILFDIDWKGARKIRKKYNIDEIIDFFILPPSKTELRKRLIKRGRENSKEIRLRLSYAFKEMQHYKEYKYILINESVNKTVNEIKKIIEFEEENLNNKKLLAKNLKRIINF